MAMVYGVYKEQEYEILFENSNFLSIPLIDINFFFVCSVCTKVVLKAVSCINLVSASLYDTIMECNDTFQNSIMLHTLCMFHKI